MCTFHTVAFANYVLNSGFLIRNFDLFKRQTDIFPQEVKCRKKNTSDWSLLCTGILHGKTLIIGEDVELNSKFGLEHWLWSPFLQVSILLLFVSIVLYPDPYFLFFPGSGSEFRMQIRN